MEIKHVSGHTEEGRFEGELYSWAKGKAAGRPVLLSDVAPPVQPRGAAQRQESAARVLGQDGAQMCQTCACSLRHSVGHTHKRLLTLESTHKPSHWLSTYRSVELRFLHI